MLEFENKFREIIEKINKDADVKYLVTFYKNASSAERQFMRENIDRSIVNKLLSFSFSAAVEGVRKNSRDKILDGLIAQSIEDAKKDYRDNVIILFLLHYSATRLGIDFREIAEEVIKLSSDGFADLLVGFIKRDDLNNDIVLLSGYKIIETPEFDYVWAKSP